MDVEKWMPQRTIFECIVGSRAYGLHTPESDYDYRGFCIPPLKYYLGPEFFEQKDKNWADGADRTIWNITKGVHLLTNCNPQMVELLFIPRELVVKTTHYWESLRKIRSAFLSQRAKSAYLGFADAQRKRMEAWAIHGITPENTAKRNKEASHMIRLLYQGISLLATGELSVALKGDQQEICMGIKQGKWQDSAVRALADDLIWHLKREGEKTALPPLPNYAKVYKVMHEVVDNFMYLRGRA